MKNLKILFYTVLVAVFAYSCDNDDDSMTAAGYAITVDRDVVTEGDGTVTFTITAPISNELEEITYEITGSAGLTDFSVNDPNGITLSGGASQATVSFIISEDNEVEGDETFTVTLKSRENIDLALENQVSATVTIIDNDTFPFANGLLISNEGPFGGGFGSVSFASADLQTVQNGIYEDVNNDNLGNIVQSIGFNNDQAYVIANNANRITVVNRFSFQETARIETGLNNPRYFVAIGDNGYVTNWGDPSVATDDFIAIIDLASNTVTGTIPVVEGPELLLYNGTTLYVAHKGGFGVNNKVSAIDPVSNAVITQITVGDVPNGLQLIGGDLWVLAGGSPSFTGNETGGSLSRINTTTNAVEETVDFATTAHPNYLNVNDGNLIYFLDGAVFSQDSRNTSVLPTQLFSTSFFYNMNVIEGKLYGCNAGDFASDGTVEVYDLATGSLETTLEVGIIPGNVYLNE